MRVVQRVISVLLFIATGLSGARAPGSTEHLDVLSDAAAFTDYHRNWIYTCNDPVFARLAEDLKRQIPDFDLTTEFRSYVETTILLGLKRLADINPDFANQLVAQSAGRRLILSCGRSAGENGSYIPSFLALIARLRFGTVLFDHLALISPASRIVEVNELRAKNKNAFPRWNQLRRRTVFHEFLHFVGADNKNWRQHSSKHAEEDTIYSCADTAFPVPHNLNNQKTCVLCSLARYTTGGIVVSLSDFSRHRGETKCSERKLEAFLQ